MNTLLFLLLALSLPSTQGDDVMDDKETRILLRENFDEGADEGLAQALLANSQITLAQGAGPDGSNAIRVAYEGYERGSKRVVVHHPLEGMADQATLSFDVCFDQDFQWVLGGKLHGLGPINPVTGGEERRADGWSARTMFGKEGNCATYLYDQDQQNKWGIGQKTQAPVFVAGQWHHLVLQVSLNDPGMANGHARLLIDNKQVLQTQGVVFRGEGGDETKIQTLLFSTFHGGNNPKWTPVDDQGNPTTVYAYFDNFLVTQGISQEASPK